MINFITMDKQEFLKSLTLEELDIIRNISNKDISNEIVKRDLAKCNFKIQVGEYYKYTYSDIIYIHEIVAVHEDCVTCNELQILLDETDFIMYEDMTYDISHYLHATPFNKESFCKIKVLYDECVNAIDRLNASFYEQITKCL